MIVRRGNCEIKSKLKKSFTKMQRRLDEDKLDQEEQFLGVGKSIEECKEGVEKLSVNSQQRKEEVHSGFSGIADKGLLCHREQKENVDLKEKAMLPYEKMLE